MNYLTDNRTKGAARHIVPFVLATGLFLTGFTVFALLHHDPLLNQPIEFELVDHNSKLFTQNNIHGKWALICFGFTHCVDEWITEKDAIDFFFIW